MSPSPKLERLGETYGRHASTPGLPRGRTDRYSVRVSGPERGRIITRTKASRTTGRIDLR